MDREKVYPGQIPLETHILQTAKDAMIGVSKLAEAVLGTSTLASGLACTPSGLSDHNVLIAPGQIYQLAAIDSTAYSSLPADTTHQIVKQGVLLDALNSSAIYSGGLVPPGSGSQYYLIQACFQENDGGSTVLPYYNSANPTQAWSGPNNDGSADTTRRFGTLVLAVKAGVAATSPTIPAPDTGYIGLWAIMVTAGDTSVLSGNISVYDSTKFINSTLTQLAPSASPVFTGTPTAPTPGANDNSSKLATTAYVDAALSLGNVPTGAVQHYFGSTPPAGWVVRNGCSIGNASSGASGRANADTAALFALIWGNTDNTTDGGAFALQDSTGAVISRGSYSASTAFAANCRLPLPDDRGLFDRGLNSTGSGTDSGRLLATSQQDALQGHYHQPLGAPSAAANFYGQGGSRNAQLPDNDGGASDDFRDATTGTAVTDGTNGSPRLAAETRPANRAYLPIIKL